jgi:hypothetical protein
MFDIQTPGLAELIARFARQPAAQHTRMGRAMHDATALVQNQASDNIARLFNKPGDMQNTLSSKVDDAGTTLTGTVTAAGKPYLRIQEYGGVIHLPEIFPVNAQALHWLGPAKVGFSGAQQQDEVFAMHAAAHDVTLPERSYLRAALFQRKSEIIAGFAGTVAFSP